MFAAVQAHIKLTHAEPECLYFVIEPDASNSCRLHVEEVFTDNAAFEFHQRRGAASDWAEITEDIERHFTIKQI